MLNPGACKLLLIHLTVLQPLARAPIGLPLSFIPLSLCLFSRSSHRHHRPCWLSAPPELHFPAVSLITGENGYVTVRNPAPSHSPARAGSLSLAAVGAPGRGCQADSLPRVCPCHGSRRKVFKLSIKQHRENSIKFYAGTVTTLSAGRTRPRGRAGRLHRAAEPLRLRLGAPGRHGFRVPQLTQIDPESLSRSGRWPGPLSFNLVTVTVTPIITDHTDGPIGLSFPISTPGDRTFPELAVGSLPVQVVPAILNHRTLSLAHHRRPARVRPRQTRSQPGSLSVTRPLGTGAAPAAGAAGAARAGVRFTPTVSLWPTAPRCVRYGPGHGRRRA
eukprot:273006-Hanusia_phi.AAC.1